MTTNEWESSVCHNKMLFFSGGTALNNIYSVFKVFTDSVYVLPISDNGGSSSVIMDVIGGPSIGDIRSRIIRLADDSTPEAKAVGKLLMYRLPLDPIKSKSEWHLILEGDHTLWDDISESYKETIRAFLIQFNTELLRQASRKPFTFSNGSVGNFFLTGTRIFFSSLETSLFWFSRVVRIPANSCVMPVINTNNTMNIGVELENGILIRGQHDISHPNLPLMMSSPIPNTTIHPINIIKEIPPHHFTAPPLNRRNSHENVVVDKSSSRPLEAKIKRLFYLNDDKQEILPPCNPSVLQKIREQQTIVYALGSLWTSTIPCLVLEGVGEEISRKSGNKILILNGYPDRETHNMTATDFVLSITNALNRWGVLSHAPRKYLTHLVWVEGSAIKVEEEAVRAMGVQCICVPCDLASLPGSPQYAEAPLVAKLRELT